MTSVRIDSSKSPSRLRAVKGAWRKISPSRRAGWAAEPKHDDSQVITIKPDSKDSLGLNLLYDPPDAQIDFIFVHGLGGGSRMTWSFSTDPRHYWPKEWLPADAKFASVRIHSFGYNADWKELGSNMLNILDFAQSLVGEMRYSEHVGSSNTKIVLIGHSMGGIVIKKAYLLAREDPGLKELSQRIHTMFFIATPHGGSGIAKICSNILAVTCGTKPYVDELSRNSESIRVVNDSFRRCASNLQLFSYYETLPTGIVGIVVDPTSAILGLEHEECLPLNADHRGICKFQDKNDSNYRTLRNAFIDTINKILSKSSSTESILQYEQLDEFTNWCTAPEDELATFESTRIPGSCEWLSVKSAWKEWQKDESGCRPFLWLDGQAGSGKSFLASRVITKLRMNGPRCSYFFFKKGNLAKYSVLACLRSLANQMARSDDSVLQKLVELQKKRTFSPETLDEQTLWRKLFLGCIFKDMPQTHFWVIDGVDECQNNQLFLSLLVSVPRGVKIFITSRSNSNIHNHIGSQAENSYHYQITNEDTVGDFQKFIDCRLELKSVGDDDWQQHFKQNLLKKASGSFLWGSLVVRKLKDALSEEQAEEVLNEVPRDMNDLYGEMLEMVLQNKFAVVLARPVYIWTLLSLRPLKVDGLRCAIKLDANQTVNNLEKLIPTISGGFIFVNQKYEAEIIHETAKSYLLRQKIHPDLAICKWQSQTQIAKICLTLLAGNFARLQPSPQSTSQKRPLVSALSPIAPDLATYVCEYFSDHLRNSSSEDDGNWDLLCKFLNCNLLAWIEFLAKNQRLHFVTQTARNLKAYFGRRVKYLSPISPQKSAVEDWIYDIFRLSAKFGLHLKLSSSSIQYLIPSMCPSTSMVSKYLPSLSSKSGFTIKGLTDQSWDDCLARIDYPSSQTSAIACGEKYSAVALSDGSIHLYLLDSVQPQITLNHGGRASLLLFSSEDLYLASCGQRKVKIWDLTQGALLWTFDTGHQILSLLFVDNEYRLIGATQGNNLITWDLSDGKEVGQWKWTDSIRGNAHTTTTSQWPSPSRAVLSPAHSMLAVSYRGLPLHLLDITTQRFVGVFNRQCESASTCTKHHSLIEAFAFNASSLINVLITSYGDGELVVYDIESKQPRSQIPEVFAHRLKCSPDGRTLVTGSSRGSLQVFEFAGASGQRLVPLYTINSHDDGIRDVAFSSDSHRIADIRGSQYRVWEPAALAYNDDDEGSQSDLSHAVTFETKSIGIYGGPLEPEITSMCCNSSGDFVFCGKKDGVVCFFDIRTATQQQVLYRHASGVGVNCIMFMEKSHLLVTGDESGRVLINSIAVSTDKVGFIVLAAEIRTEHSLLSVLHDFSSTKILLRTRKSIEIWTTSGENVGEAMCHDIDEAQFYNHPLESKYFISVGRQGPRLFSWDQGLKVEASEGDQTVDVKVTPPTPTTYKFSMGNPPIACNEPWNPSFFAHIFTNRSPMSIHSDKELNIWPASCLNPAESIPLPLPLGDFRSQAHRIRQSIAMAENTLFFLDIDLWICSLDITSLSMTQVCAQRHFFLLSEWQSISGGFLIDYIPTTQDFVVSKKDALLVISGGLGFRKPWITKDDKL